MMMGIARDDPIPSKLSPYPLNHNEVAKKYKLYVRNFFLIVQTLSLRTFSLPNSPKEVAFIVFPINDSNLSAFLRDFL
jgi:hypothetical protein